MSSDPSSYGACDNKAIEENENQILNETKDTKYNVDLKKDDTETKTITQDQRNSKQDKRDTIADRETKKIGFKNFFPTLLLLLKSPTFVLLCLAYTCSFMVITSLAVFMAKTVQFQYNQTPPMAAIMAGKHT